VCPTCGTELTDEHREHVLAGYRERARAVIQQVKLDDQWLGEQNTTLDALQQSLAGLDAEIQAGTEAEQELIRLEAELGKREELAQQLSEATARRNELAGQLRSNAYAPALHQRLNEAEEHLSSIDFDPAALDEAQRTAAFKDRWEREARELRHVENEIERLTPLIERQQRELAAARDQLDAGHPQLTEQRRRLEAQRAEIGYDGERHAAVRNAIRELETVRARVTQLLGAEETIERALAERMSAQQEEAQLSSRIEKGQTMLAELRVQIESLGEAETRTQEMAEQKAALDEQRSELQTQIGTVQAKLNQRAEEKKELADQRARKKEASHEKRLYRNLRTAFGKNGIPSLIIEQTLPEVEDRTNELLAGLSGNTARVKLETLKDKKSGGTKETLELRITDAQGVSRPYETFSGGEAFRVNFALRLALSQLLAERSGVRIRTLVIDEGFGTQDQEGVQNLVDAIQAIQSDFDKIIVITHLNELKEAFPVRIEVEKHPVTGSQCEVVAA
ncbi:MAG: SMC family ATPase, partial [Bacteroidota bacterium]